MFTIPMAINFQFLHETSLLKVKSFFFLFFLLIHSLTFLIIFAHKNTYRLQFKQQISSATAKMVSVTSKLHTNF